MSSESVNELADVKDGSLLLFGGMGLSDCPQDTFWIEVKAI